MQYNKEQHYVFITINKIQENGKKVNELLQILQFLIMY